jgi:hypothetical protein
LAKKDKKHYKIINSNKSISENKKVIIKQINSLIR